MRTLHVTSFLLLCILLPASSSPAFAWGATGHRIVATLAEERLSPAARAALADLLGGETLATASTWADEMRSAPDVPESFIEAAAPWHYVNIPEGATYAQSARHPGGDVLAALTAFSAILRDQPVPAGPVRAGLESYFGDLDARKPELKRFALRFLVHIVADLQQPLHSGYEHDRGGNGMRVSWFGARSNLHSVWDTQLIAQQDLGYREYAARLAARIDGMSAAELRRIAGASPLAWTDEARALLPQLYARAEQRGLGAAYYREFRPVVETQLLKGALRTAYVLNQIFSE